MRCRTSRAPGVPRRPPQRWRALLPALRLGRARSDAGGGIRLRHGELLLVPATGTHGRAPVCGAGGEGLIHAAAGRPRRRLSCAPGLVVGSGAGAATPGPPCAGWRSIAADAVAFAGGRDVAPPRLHGRPAIPRRPCPAGRRGAGPPDWPADGYPYGEGRLVGLRAYVDAARLSRPYERT